MTNSKVVEAWANGAVGTNRVVAIIDTGIDYRHPDQPQVYG